MDYFWIQDSMKGRCVTFPGHGTWRIDKKLSEKERAALRGEGYEWRPSEAHAVYECHQTEGPHAGQVAILKLRIQIPGSYPSAPHCDEGAKFAEHKEYHVTTCDEIYFLRRLTKGGCTAAPKLIAVKEGIQDKPMLKGGMNGDEEIWVQGGYVVWILMEKLPGEDLRDFFLPGHFNLQERREIRDLFRKAKIEIERYGVRPMDAKRDNVIYDKGSKRCFFIDFEDALECGNRKWDDLDYARWNLSEDRNFYCMG